MKRIVIKQYVNADVVSIENQVIHDIEYRMMVDGNYLGDFHSKREVFIALGGVTVGLLEKDYEVIVDDLLG